MQPELSRFGTTLIAFFACLVVEFVATLHQHLWMTPSYFTSHIGDFIRGMFWRISYLFGLAHDAMGDVFTYIGVCNPYDLGCLKKAVLYIIYSPMNVLEELRGAILYSNIPVLILVAFTTTMICIGAVVEFCVCTLYVKSSCEECPCVWRQFVNLTKPT